MKYTPRALDPEAADASRGHDRHPLKELALLTVGVGLICLALYLVAVLVAEAIVARIAPATEIRLFSSFSRSLPQPKSLAPGLEERKAMADRLLPELLEHSDLKGLPVKLIVWESAHTNAVALPGHTIAVTTGLLNCLDEESAMAFVLAHELAHFSGRDHLRGLGRQVSFQVIMALVFSSQGDLQMGASQAGQMAFLAHSRKREAAADRYAMTLVQRALGSGDGATRLFELLDDQHLPPWAYMFQSHPATAERIKALRQQAETPSPAKPD
jgi:Zn-dependent protease with chaperone function